MNWRYVKAPTFAYRVLLAERRGQPVGYCVYRLQETAGRKLGFIAELLTPQSDTPARSTLIARTLRQLRAEGAEAAITLAIPNTPISRAFRRAGFIFSWGSFKVYLAPLDPRCRWILCGIRRTGVWPGAILTLSSSLRQSAKRALHAAAESAWGCGFTVASRLLHPQVDSWSSPGQQHILVVAPTLMMRPSDVRERSFGIKEGTMKFASRTSPMAVDTGPRFGC